MPVVPPHRRPLILAAVTVAAAVLALPPAWAGASSHPQPQEPPPVEHPRSGPRAIVVDQAVRDSMNAIFTRGNEHWDELAEVNTLTQMLGGKPTQLEYLGCLQGRVERDTVFVTGWEPARNMKRLQFAVTGSCEEVAARVGTFHTHPYRAASDGRALKERSLSKADLETFGGGADPVVFAVWDVDSLDAAARSPDGLVRHPAGVAVRPTQR